MNEVSWVTKLYLFIKGWKTPVWLRPFIDKLNGLIINIFSQICIEEYNFLISSVVRQNNEDISGEEKMMNIINDFRDRYTENAIRTRSLRLIIETIVSELTDAGTIK